MEAENTYQFRVWDNMNKRWVNNQPHIYYSIDLLGQVRKYDTREVWELVDELRYNISQYIGRKDSKGVKAFTGDIISFKYRPEAENIVQKQK